MKLAAAMCLSALVLPAFPGATARAQAPEPGVATGGAPAATPQVAYAPPRLEDVLILVDGSEARGTLLERNARGDIVFLTALGETRRLAGSEVRYVGPVRAPAPAQPSQPVVPSSAPLTLQLVAVGPPVRFHARGLLAARTPEGTQRPVQRQTLTLCTAPCKSELAPGSYQFSLSLDDGDPLTVEGPLLLDRNGVLFGTYKSRDTQRRAGLGVFAMSGVLGAALTLLAARCLPDEGGYCKREDGYRATGITILSTGLLTGLVLMLLPDKAQVSWLPKD